MVAVRAPGTADVGTATVTVGSHDAALPQTPAGIDTELRGADRNSSHPSTDVVMVPVYTPVPVVIAAEAGIAMVKVGFHVTV